MWRLTKRSIGQIKVAETKIRIFWLTDKKFWISLFENWTGIALGQSLAVRSADILFEHGMMMSMSAFENETFIRLFMDDMYFLSLFWVTYGSRSHQFCLELKMSKKKRRKKLKSSEGTTRVYGYTKAGVCRKNLERMRHNH